MSTTPSRRACADRLPHYRDRARRPPTRRASPLKPRDQTADDDPRCRGHDAATLIAAIGDVHRFPTAKRLVGYLGIDPRVRQSGQRPAREGRISEQGSSACGTCSSKPPGQRSKHPGRCARSTSAPAPAAAPRSRSSRPPANSPRSAGNCSPPPGLRLQTPDHRRPQPPRPRAPRRRTHPPPTQHQPGRPNAQQRAQLERQLTEQAELAYQRLIQDWQATGNKTTPTATPLTFMRSLRLLGVRGPR
jgi:hypothetical protein